MARGTGGARQGTPGKSYSNRTDLNANYGQSPPGTSVASGGMSTPTPDPQAAPSWVAPDSIPRLDDPTGSPLEPVTHGLSSGAGGGPEVMGGTPGDPTMNTIRAAYLAHPTPELERTMKIMALRYGQV